MTIEAALGMAAFAGMFVAWAVLPSLIKRRHARAEAEREEAGT